MRFALLGVVLYIAITVYAVIDAATSDRGDVRGVSKSAWIPIIVLLPVLGAVLWFLLGRPRFEPQPHTQSMAPDDDPAFLRDLERSRRNLAREAELNKREQELRAREEHLRKDDDGGTGEGAGGGSPRPTTS